MSNIKNCAYCNAQICRGANTNNHNWNRRRFCNSACRKALDGRLTRQGNRSTQSNRSDNAPITLEEANKFVFLIKEGIPGAKAAKLLGRANAEVLTRRAVMFGILPTSRPIPVKERVSAPAKQERFEPLPAGAPETWADLMPDTSWKDAVAMTSHMVRF